MLDGLNWAVLYDGRIRALFVARWQAEQFIEMLHNKEEWSVKYIKA